MTRTRWTMRRAACLLAAAVTATAVAAPPAAAQEPIQPGASIRSDGGQCTLNWVYDGTGARAGEVFVGTAAHCVEEVGDQITLQTGTFGSDLYVIGLVAFISSNLDYSLIRIDDANLELVDPSLKGHPEFPTGVSTTSTANVGDLVQFSGQGVGFHLTQPTREERVGILHFNDGDHHSALGPVISGDSGGPVGNITDGNKALGLVTVICAGTQCLGEGGVSLQGMLADAAAAGFTVELRTV